ncbi:MAG: VOC family protein [Bacillota bacterium]|jgi:predicted enzyme related to lactoylglutathione lyase|nr:VOC family protein [Candidatus Fermentithermobacillaceae bacterium]
MQGGFIAFLGTKDLDATHEFYSSVLGLDLVVDQNACRIYKVPGGGFIGFCEHLEVCRAGRAPILTFVTEEVDEVYEKFMQSGVKVTSEPKSNEKYGIYHFFAQDPQGYTVEIQYFEKAEDAQHFKR